MPEYPKSPGAIWKRSGAKGEFLSISLDVDVINNVLENWSEFGRER